MLFCGGGFLGLVKRRCRLLYWVFWVSGLGISNGVLGIEIGDHITALSSPAVNDHLWANHWTSISCELGEKGGRVIVVKFDEDDRHEIP